MVSFLIPYIIHRFRQHGFANRERAITTLPGKMTVPVVNGLYPSAAIPFDLFHKMGNGFVLGQLTKQVNVVGNATYQQRLATGGVDELSYIAMNTFQMLLLNGRAGGFDVEDDVEVDFAERL